MGGMENMMSRNVWIAGAIGILATFLPFWEWASMSDQITGAMALMIVAFIVLLAVDDGVAHQLKKS